MNEIACIFSRLLHAWCMVHLFTPFVFSPLPLSLTLNVRYIRLQHITSARIVLCALSPVHVLPFCSPSISLSLSFPISLSLFKAPREHALLWLLRYCCDLLCVGFCV